MSSFTVGHGSHLVEFEHQDVGTLRVWTGVDEIEWGYSLNVARWPTYGGEVIQILSCFVDDLSIMGSVQTYEDMEKVYTYFFQYMQIAAQGDSKTVGATIGTTKQNQIPMTFRYPHRGWEIHVVPTGAPGMRKARDVVIPNWKVTCHVVDEEGDVDNIKDLILREVEIKEAIGSKDTNFDANFDLKGEITFVDENPFSDPWTNKGTQFTRKDYWDSAADFYSQLLPSYLKGDFDAITGGMGSKPAFGASSQNRALSANDSDQNANSGGTKTQQNNVDRTINAK